MWQMKRQPAGRMLSSFLALLLVITTVLNPICSMPSYATESPVKLSYGHVDEKGVEIFAESDNESFAPGTDIALNLYIKNNTEEALAGGILSVDDNDVVTDVLFDSSEGSVTDITLEPGEVRAVAFSGTVNSELELYQNAAIGFSFEANTEDGTVNSQTEFKFTTDLITLLPVEVSETDVLQAGQSYSMTLTLDLDENTEWVKVITSAKTDDATPSNATSTNATPSNTTKIEELLSSINYTLKTYGAEFSKAEIKNVNIDYSNYEIEATIAFTVAATAEAGESFGTVTAVVRLDGNEKYYLSQSFGYEVEGAVALTEAELAEVQKVIEMIEELPDPEEMWAKAEALLEDEDEEGYIAYMKEMAAIGLPIMEAYNKLSDAQKALVTNAEKLLSSSGFWGTVTLDDAMSRDPISGINVNENINIHLFNYGSNINDDEIRVLDFNNGSIDTTNGSTTTTGTLKPNVSSYYYLDGHGVYDARIYSYRPIMAKTLGEDGYPLVLRQKMDTSYSDTTDAEGNIISTTYHSSILNIYEVQNGLLKQTDGILDSTYNYGSLRYLFDKDSTTVLGKGDITYKDVDKKGVKYFYNRPSGYTDPSSTNALFDKEYGYATKYRTKHYNLNGDGGLFQVIDGYYEYDSRKNAAYYNEDENKFEVYNHLIAPGHTYNNPDGNNWVNFFPFNKPIVNTTMTDTAGNKYVAAGDVVVEKDGNTPEKTNATGKEVYVLASGRTAEDHDNNSKTDAEYVDKSEALVDTWFGMSMEFDFFIPKDGQIALTDKDGEPINGEDGKQKIEDLIFEFAGDDDVWVYIDDVLILDIGGCHGAQNGTINFASGVVNTPTSSTNNTPISGTTLKSLFEGAGKDTSDFDGDTFADYTSHKLKFFYMERGGNISYCKLKFNLPTLPENSLMVTKEVEDYGTFFADKDMDYTFRVMKEVDAEGTKEVALAGETFQIYENGQLTSKTGTVSSDGTFKLKDTQSALFTGMILETELAGGYQYYVEEIIPQDQIDWYSKVEYRIGSNNSVEAVLDSESGSYSTTVLKADAANAVTFTNYPKLGNLVITKTVKGVRPEDMEDYSVDITIEGNMLATDSNCTLDIDSVKHYNEQTQTWTVSETVYGLPAGNYTVTEYVDKDIAEKLAVEYDGPSAKVNEVDGKSTTVVVTDGDDANANFTNTYALRSLEISKDMFTDQDKPYLAESELPNGTTFAFTLEASQNVGTFRYKIYGSTDGVKVNGKEPKKVDKEKDVYEASFIDKKATIELIKLDKQDEFSVVKLIKIPNGMTCTVTEKAYTNADAPVGDVSSELVDVTLVGGTENPNGAVFTWDGNDDREKSVTFVNSFQWNARVKVTKHVTNANEAPDREFMIQIVNENGTYVDTAAVLKDGETSGTIRVDETTTLVVTEAKVKEFDLVGITATGYKLDKDGNVTNISHNVEVTENGNKYTLVVEPGYSYEIQVDNTYDEEPYFHDDNGKMNVVGVEDGKAVPKNPETKTSPTTVAMAIESRFLNRKEDEFEVQDDTTAVV